MHCKRPKLRSPFFVAALIALSACGGAPSSGGAGARGGVAAEKQPPYRFLSGAASAPAVAPVALTASDGTGLRLVRLEARAVIEGPLAFTELALAFENLEERTLEGHFSMTLPSGASVSRFAMRLDDRWQEGEVVERQKARVAYEDFLHRKQDPALLEQGAGNQFTARVFPIPARSRKELILSYAQEIGADRRYVLPLRGLPEIEELVLRVSAGGQLLHDLSAAAVTPAADVDLVLPERDRGGLRSGELVVARVRPTPRSAPDPLGATTLLVDTSASRALGFEEQVRLVQRLAHELARRAGAGTPLDVAAFDQETTPIFSGRAGDFGERELASLRERQAFGASDLGRALAWAEARGRAHGARRVVVIGDGVATAGEVDAERLLAAAKRLGAAGVERIDAIATGGVRDDELLRRLVTSGLARAGVVVDGAAALPEMMRRLTETARSGIAVQIEGARWSWPTTLDGVQAGDEALVYAEVPVGVPVRLSVGGAAPVAVDLSTVARPLLERALVQAKIARLLRVEPASDDRTRQIVDLSVAHRVLTPYTALLVLETEADYARFRIDRRALTDVLTVDAGQVIRRKRGAMPVLLAAAPPRADDREIRARSTPAEAPVRAAPETAATPAPVASGAAGGSGAGSARGNLWGDEIGESFGAGGLGLAGVGEGGGGRGEIGLGRTGVVGHGAGVGSGQGLGGGAGRSGGGAASAPRLAGGAPQVSGRISPEVIQRVVRRSYGRMRACYEQGLLRAPGLAGRIVVRFSIAPNGAVVSAQDGGSDLADRQIIACVVRAFDALTFPELEGIVTVTYPIVFRPDGAPAPPQSARTPEPEPPPVDPYNGRFKAVMELLAARRVAEATDSAHAWHREAPADVLALVALGEALEAAGQHRVAARCYGSIIDLFPSRADLRRFAGQRLERTKDRSALELAVDSYEKARDSRPDHPSSHRLLAFARLKSGDPAKAFDAAIGGATRSYPSARFRGVERVLREDLGLIGAAWIHAEPGRRSEVIRRLAEAGAELETSPSLRFVLHWETDANDVDFHIDDAEGGHAYYLHPRLGRTGELYADVTTGYGPECFTVRGPRERRSARYQLRAHYYSRGPMGYGMGKLQVVDHDGKGGLTFDERPFVVMTDRAFVDLGTVTR